MTIINAVLGWLLLILGGLLALVSGAATVYFGGKVLWTFTWGILKTFLLGKHWVTYESDRAMLKDKFGWIVNLFYGFVGFCFAGLAAHLIDYARSLIGWSALFK